ncbi:hypothetical protein [Streptomyces lonegramiae]|uniref:Uncharacterized protein n=1 Tax=Streptomyces lonegramiae TaxID=3075524 RepID=A0ABU2XW20_9ACTN|nr:hypothetical protein [Streptomyces sp. DSM 41529]MDT0549659.1 hypothetical protein [Streptomyces sp. DSM 41529]
MRCGICGSGRLSPVGELTSSDSMQKRLRLRFPRPGALKARPTFHAGFARACRDCGALLPFLGEEERRRLDAEAEGLAAAEGGPADPDSEPRDAR